MKSKVIETKLPSESILNARIKPIDFLDCYSVQSTLSPRRAAEIITDFPTWAKYLLFLRRLITTPFGLSNDGPEVEDKLGAFPVEF